MGRDGRGFYTTATLIRVDLTVSGRRIAGVLTVAGRPLAPSPANLRYAARVVEDIRDKVRLGTYDSREYFSTASETGGVTVATQLADWITTQRIEESTAAGYRAAIKFWTETEPAGRAPLGSMLLRAVKRSDIERTIAARADLTGKTVNNYVSVLRKALQMAVDDDVLSSNPAGDIERAKHQAEPPDPFEADERDRILAKMAERHPGQVANFVEFWFWSGLRTSEIQALRWEHVDLVKGEILIREATVRGVHKDRTKTNRTRRVALNSVARATVERQRAHTQLKGGAVFEDPRYGEPWTEERAFRRSFWTPVVKALGIRYRRPYNCRHTYATAMLMAGMTPAFCARQLGHSVEVFLRTYAKWLDGRHNDLEMSRLEASIRADSHRIPTQTQKKTP